MDMTRLSLVFLEYGIKAVGLVVLVQTMRGLWWIVNLFFIAPLSDPLRHLPGPDTARFSNHFDETMDPERTPHFYNYWVRLFGKTFRYHGFGAHDYRLMTFDVRALSYILNSPTFEKPWQTRRLLSQVLDQGLFAMEGEKHRIQRRILAPAFTPQAVKNMSSIMLSQAEELRDKWCFMIADGAKSKWDYIIAELPESALPQCTGETEKNAKEEMQVDVAHWISRAALDVIGLAGFDYPFQALETETEEVYLAYRTMFDSMDTFGGFKRIAEIFFPIIRTVLPDKGVRQVNASLKTIRRKGEEIIRNKKKALMAEISTSKERRDKDILSLLIKANLSENPSLRLSDSELLDQISTFLFAGSDTTAVAIAWSLHHLSLNPEIQSRLRNELASWHVDPLSDTASVDALDNLPFLDAVVRESLRLAPPVHGTIRVAMKDDVIPLSNPILLRTNEVVEGVHIRKGSYVHIPIEGMNCLEDIWGKDALLFRPDRWTASPTSASPCPGLANVMSFIFGPHACIGWRFAMLEMKVFLANLIPHLVFAPAAQIGKCNTIVTRPYVRCRLKDGPGLPLRVSRYCSS